MKLDNQTIRSILETSAIDEPLTGYMPIEMPDYAVNLVGILNSQYVLRCSDVNAELRFRREGEILDRLREFEFVPTILGEGPIPGLDNGYFQIQSRVPGDTLQALWPHADQAERTSWITQLATAMGRVHVMRCPAYRIGVYQTAIRDWSGSWAAGHDIYMNQLLDGVYARSPTEGERALLQRAERFYADHRGSLAFESGPGLGHGDLHLLNVLGTPSGISGIIDWEWAFGGGVEPDFDLDALVRWALFPADIGDDSVESPLTPEMFQCVIPTLLREYPGLATIPMLSSRMTIYQVEHELHHLLTWKPAIPRQPLVRLSAWVDDRILEGAMTV